MPAIMEESEQLDNFCRISFHTPLNNHVDERLSRVTRDKKDCNKFEDWFICHNPFPVGVKSVEGARQSDCVIIAVEDIDLLVILTAVAPDSNRLFLMKPGKGKKTLFYSPTSLKMSKKEKDNILFLHAFNGCDSMSAIFRQGKMVFLMKMQGYKTMLDYLKTIMLLLMK
ncbi:hypothetical protein AVEN_111337-1 [Araneus ventricosus]|uniref:Uncharacterized protein n=1 Tax=Araneus ventricosus TaxID=182803 RepID=A0A4Y2GHC3_ARAVE|nr:hypothetical protein AVEN_111337-1 [Araneus ventricosus]